MKEKGEGKKEVHKERKKKERKNSNNEGHEK